MEPAVLAGQLRDAVDELGELVELAAAHGRFERGRHGAESGFLLGEGTAALRIGRQRAQQLVGAGEGVLRRGVRALDGLGSLVVREELIHRDEVVGVLRRACKGHQASDLLFCQRAGGNAFDGALERRERLRVALLDANDLLTQLRKPVRERVQPARQLPQLVELRQISTLQTARDSRQRSVDLARRAHQLAGRAVEPVQPLTERRSARRQILCAAGQLVYARGERRRALRQRADRVR